MTSIEFPTHMHLHPHATVADYDEVGRLAHEHSENPFLVFLPEIPDVAVSEFQLISDGSRALHRTYQQRDKKNSNHGVSLDMNFARTRALSEAVFNTGLVIASIHPSWDEQVAADNSVALRKNHCLKPTFLEAIETLVIELPQIVRVIQKRDNYAASNFTRILTHSTSNIPEFAGLDSIKCLIEIGSLHFQLAEKLSDKGIPVTVSGDSTIEKLPGAFERGVGYLLAGGKVTDLDLELITLEDALNNDILATSTAEKQRLVDSLIASIDKRNWGKSYEIVAGAVNNR